jgi:hypothetical protein
MLAMSESAITGWFTLGAALGVAIVAGYFSEHAWRGDREAANRQRQADAADRREERMAVDMMQWRDVRARAPGRARQDRASPEPFVTRCCQEVRSPRHLRHARTEVASMIRLASNETGYGIR